MSLGDALELVMKLQEKHIKDKQIDYNLKLIEYQKKFKELAKQVIKFSLFRTKINRFCKNKKRELSHKIE